VYVKFHLGSQPSLEGSGDAGELKTVIEGFYVQVNVDLAAAVKRITADTVKINTAADKVAEVAGTLNETAKTP
jgi:hypothetical protein